MADPREVLTRPAPAPPLTVAYGPLPDQVVDVWPTGGGAPLLIYVHGGFWRARFDRMHARPLANDLAGRGYTVAAIEYRRVGQPDGGWPGTFADLALAVDTVPGVLDGQGVQVGPVVLVGHSAGGHLVLWAANRHRLPEDSPWRLVEPPSIQGVLALAPVCDLAQAYHDNLDDGAVADLLGGGPDLVPQRYRATDPGMLPLPETPTILVHGTVDDRVPVTQSQRYAGRGPVRLEELPGTEHFAVIDPLSAAWPTVLTALGELAVGMPPGRNVSFA